MKYKIAIPSYKRPETIQKKTLSYLAKCNVDFSNVDVFVADEAEYKDYVQAQKNFGFNLLIGAHSVRGQREFIRHHYPEGTMMLGIDDDIDGIFVKLSDRKFELETNVDAICQQGFEAAKAARTKLWGISAVLNPLFMRNTVTFDLKYIVACFYGQEIDHDPNLAIQLEDKEDFERSILYFKKFGAVARLNNYAPKTKYYKEPGGMQVTRTVERITESAHYLAKKYPQYCKINTSKKSDHAEVKLITPKRKAI